MYQVGDFIVYGGTGVCRVSEITKPEMAEDDRLYYVLTPLFESGTIYTPVDGGKVFMRPIVSRSEAEQLIDSIPSLHAEVDHAQGAQQLAEHYRTAMNHSSCADLIELTMSIWNKKKLVESQKRRFGQIDGRFMKRAEDMLFGELSVALDIPPDQVSDYINERLNGREFPNVGIG